MEAKSKPFHTFLSAILFLAAIVKLVNGEMGENFAKWRSKKGLTSRSEECSSVVDCR